MKRKAAVRYSEAFKIQIVEEFEKTGITQSEIRRKYGINGSETLKGWLRKYGKEHLLNRVIRVEKPGEQYEIKKLKKEIKKLKDAMAELHIENIINKSTMQATAESMGMTVDELKKKLGVE